MISTIIAHAHSTLELLLRQKPMTPDIEEAIKLQDDIILKASELKDERLLWDTPLDE